MKKFLIWLTILTLGCGAIVGLGFALGYKEKLDLELENGIKLEQVKEELNVITELKTQVESEKVTLETRINELNVELEELKANSGLNSEEYKSLLEEKNILEAQLFEKEAQITALNEQLEIYENALNRDESKTYIEDILISGEIYSHKISDTEYFISSSNNSVSGLFLYNTIDYSVTQLGYGDYGYDLFTDLVNGDIFISSSYNQNALTYIYNNESKNVNRLAIGYSPSSYALSNGDCLYYHKRSKGVCLYDASLGLDGGLKDPIIILGLDVVPGYLELENGKVLIYNLEGSLFLYSYDIETQEIVLLSDSSDSVYGSFRLNDSQFLITTNNFFNMIDFSNNTVVQLETDSTFSELPKSVKYYVNYYSLSNGTLLIGASINGTWLFSLNINDLVVSIVSKNSTTVFDFYEMENGNVLITSNITSATTKSGLFEYDVSANTLTQLNRNVLKDFSVFYESSKYVMLSSPTNYNNCLFVYNKETKAVSNFKLGSYKGWKHVYELSENKFLILSNLTLNYSDSVIALYDGEVNKFKSLKTNGSEHLYLDSFEATDTGIIIYSSKEGCNKKFLYSYETESVAEIVE